MICIFIESPQFLGTFFCGAKFFCGVKGILKMLQYKLVIGRKNYNFPVNGPACFYSLGV